MPKRPLDLAELESRLGVTFRNRALLEEAMTHPSASGPARPSNQRLEFLGDRVLGLVIAEALTDRYPEESEGALAPRLNALVRKETCAAVARDLTIGDYVHIAKSEALAGGRRRNALLGDAMEAVIAAIYLDQGMEAARGFVLDHWSSHLTAQDDAPQDAKTGLQEWAQARRLPLPEYRVLDRSGPDHAPEFTIEASVATGATATATAASKRAAQQAAAAALLEHVENAPTRKQARKNKND